MKAIRLTLLATLAIAGCKEDKDQAGDWSQAPPITPLQQKLAASRAESPQGPALQAAYEAGRKSLADLKETHRKLKAEELAASGGRHAANMAQLRELEGSIALLEADLAKLKAKIAAPQ